MMTSQNGNCIMIENVNKTLHERRICVRYKITKNDKNNNNNRFKLMNGLNAHRFFDVGCQLLLLNNWKMGFLLCKQSN